MANGNNNNGNRNPGGNENRNRQNLLTMVIVAFCVLLFMSYAMRSSSSSTQITYSEFIQLLEDGKVARIELSGDQINIAQKQAKVDDKEAPYRFYTGKAENDDVVTDRALKAGVIVDSQVTDSSEPHISIHLTYVLHPHIY